jgi:hypothetical protein
VKAVLQRVLLRAHRRSDVVPVGVADLGEAWSSTVMWSLAALAPAFWTLQNYDAYIIDDTYGPSFALNAENGPDGSVRDQFKTDWGFDLEQRVNANTPLDP